MRVESDVCELVKNLPEQLRDPLIPTLTVLCRHKHALQSLKVKVVEQTEVKLHHVSLANVVRLFLQLSSLVRLSKQAHLCVSVQQEFVVQVHPGAGLLHLLSQSAQLNRLLVQSLGQALLDLHQLLLVLLVSH
jgi:hypothetical protein